MHDLLVHAFALNMNFNNKLADDSELSGFAVRNSFNFDRRRQPETAVK